MFGPGTWCTKKPFGYQVAHHGCLLTSCPGQTEKLMLWKYQNVIEDRLKYK